MNKIQIIQFLIIFILILSNIFFIYKLKINKNKNVQNDYENYDFYVKNFNDILNCLNYFYEKTYFIMYQKYIITYVTSGYTIDEETNIKLNKEFINNLFEITGKKYNDIFINFFGDVDTYINNSLIYFNDQLINRDIKETLSNDIFNIEKNNENI